MSNENRVPIIMVHEDLFESTEGRRFIQWLGERSKAAGVRWIMVGDELKKEEVVHARMNDDLLFRHALQMTFIKTNKTCLRKPMVAYFKEKLGYDFDHMFMVSSRRHLMSKNILLGSPDFEDRVLKLLGINMYSYTCTSCKGTGEKAEFDQCGREENVYPCSSCNGAKMLHGYVVMSNDGMAKLKEDLKKWMA